MWMNWVNKGSVFFFLYNFIFNFNCNGSLSCFFRVDFFFRNCVFLEWERIEIFVL